MLFDLRSRGRRRTVQVVYIGLAVLIGAGLILFGVGTGSGGGGLFGAFTGNGASNAGNAYVTKQVKKAQAKTKADPTSAAAWAALVQARYSASNSGLSSTGVYDAAGLTQLRGVTEAYAQYTKLDKTPSATTATLRRPRLRSAQAVLAGVGHVAGRHPDEPRQPQGPRVHDADVLCRRQHPRR